MWEHYKKTLVVSQLLIVGFCAALWYYRDPGPLVLLMMFLTMQAASFLGAAFADRLKRKADAQDKELPLQRRRD